MREPPPLVARALHEAGRSRGLPAGLDEGEGLLLRRGAERGDEESVSAGVMSAGVYLLALLLLGMLGVWIGR